MNRKNKERINQFQKIRNSKQVKRDDYYSHLMKKYNCYNSEELIDIITNKENEIREKLD